ncbi:MAG: FGGY family carbohydrate kinase, partial [Clostridia bacterium]
MNNLLGIDLGTSACKVALFAPDGSVVAQATADYPVFYPKPGWAEQNPEDWWQAVQRALHEVLEGVNAADIAGIGVDGQSWSAILMDQAGEVLANTPI